MKKLLAVSLCATVVGLALAPSALGYWYVSYNQAQRAALGEARLICEGDNECYEYGAHCLRRSQKRFSCEDWTVSFGPYADITCSWLEEIGVGYGGRLKNVYISGSADCY